MDISHSWENSTTTELQNKILPILVELDRICRLHGLRYYMIGGTLIGAVRHQGFIPWDDDIDVGMPREDYMKLLSLSGDLRDQYAIHHHGNDSGYIYPYAKIYDRTTTVTEGLVRPFTRGVWIDVFPLDGAYPPGLRRSVHIGLIEILKRLIRAKFGAFYSKSISKAAARYAYYAVRFFGFFIPRRLLFLVFDKISMRIRFDRSDFMANLSGRYGAREVCATAPCGFRVYLAGIYGDYMKLPPPEKRVADHSALHIDLSRPFG